MGSIVRKFIRTFAWYKECSVMNHFRFIFLLLIAGLLLSVFTQPLQSQSRWESMIIESDTWRFLPATSEPPAQWFQPSFNDSSWASGAGGLGFGDNDDRTIIPACNSLYIRRQISLPDTRIVEDLILDIDYDDAFVLYINGVEAARSHNVPSGRPAFNATLTTDREATMYSGGAPERFQLNTSSLIRGINTFALHIINNNIQSTDLSARVFIHARINTASPMYHPVPTWFIPPISFVSSNLPLIFIETNGQTIPQDIKITADMRVLNSPTGINFKTDTIFEYNGKIGIEIRGFTSAGFPKKNFSVETRTVTGTNNNVNLLGMPRENDWVFHGPYTDKSLMRNVLAYHLGNKTGRWNPRTRFFELYLNGLYQGVYVLVEKIKIDRNRLALATLNPQDTVGNELTGGYVLKIDRPEATYVENVDFWFSPYRARTRLQQRVPFILHHPRARDLNTPQINYIRNFITSFEHAMHSDNFQDKVEGYHRYIDLQSFVDYYILTELSRNLDGYRISTFMHKDIDSRGGKLTMGPLWDFDICFGNANFFSAGNTQGWIIDGMGDADAYAMPFWWEKFRLDPYFNSHLKIRWNQMTSTFLNSQYINQFIDSNAFILRDAHYRNFDTWRILNTHVWPNNFVGGSYINELNYLKTWIRDRILWMDSQIQPIVDITAHVNNSEFFPMEMAAFPNPFTTDVNFKFHLPEGSTFELVISDMLGRQVWSTQQNLPEGTHQLPVNFSAIHSGSNLFVYQVRLNGVTRKSGKLVRH